MSALRELLASFSIQVDDRQLEEAHKSIGGFVETLKGVGAAISAAFVLGEIREFVAGTVEAGARIGDLSERLGVSAHDLQAFQFAAGLAGVEAEQAAHSLGLLNKNIGEARSGSAEASKAFAAMGVSIADAQGQARPIADVTLDLADAFAKMPDQQTRAAAAMKIFGREGQALLPVLSSGREELAKTLAEFDALGGGMSGDFVKSAKQVDDETKKLSVGWVGLKTAIASQLLPYILQGVEAFKRFFVQVREVTQHSHALRNALEFLKAGAVVAGVYKLVTAVQALTRSEVLAAAPWALVAAAILVAYLAFDELKTLLEGGDTLIGRALGPDKQKFITDLRAALGTLNETFEQLGTLIGSDGTALGTFTTIVVDAAKALAALVEWGAKAIDIIKNVSLGLQVGGKLGLQIATGNEQERNLALGEYQTSKLGEERGKALDRAAQANAADDIDQQRIGQQAREQYLATHPQRTDFVGPP